ncbi:MAG: type II toxin-antitoxin system HicB family antitoxin, partial [Dehalococcoidia bacterium]|nr:type II toxin-antitoxin system HicB family antitoxin [Dehalococcoidia bacterium]
CFCGICVFSHNGSKRMNTKRSGIRKAIEDMRRTANGDVSVPVEFLHEVIEALDELDPSREASKRAYLALAKLRESHREEYDFYVEQAKKRPVEKWEELPNFPIRLTDFSLTDYVKAALAIAEYEEDDGMIVASVPVKGSFFTTQAENYEEARTNLMDAIEGCVMIDLQMGWDVPEIPGFEVKYEVVPNNAS